MEQIIETLRDWGPWAYALLVGYCALKSGAMPLFAGYLAALGALDPWLAAAASFAGAWLGDEARFFVARHYGPALRRRPRLAPHLRVADALLERHGAGYLFLYRYTKGLRTVGALPVGLSGWTWRRFAPLNAASAATWSLALVGGGYWLGEAAVATLGEAAGAFGVALLVLATIAGVWLWWRETRAQA